MNTEHQEQPLLVTVYVLTYKKFDSIYRNLQSVIDQDYPSIELIVSDDGSPNFPKTDISSFIDSNKGNNIQSVIILDNQENVGTVKHINNALSHANGEILIPLSADDEFFNESVVKEIVKEYEKRHFNVLTTSRLVVNENNENLFFLPHILSRPMIRLFLNNARNQYLRYIENRYYAFCSGSVMVMNRDFFIKMGCHDENFIYWEDGPFMQKITALGYSITRKYGIISIKYHWGGVSNSGFSIMKNDIELFHDQYRSKEILSLPVTTRRIIEYDNKRKQCESKADKMKLKFQYLDSFLREIFYLYGLKVFKHIDRIIVRLKYKEL